MKIAVIGSGPSGWAATKTLTKLGHEVTIIDSSLIESDATDNGSNNIDATLNRKLHFGSDLPYRNFPFGPSLNSQEVNPIFSFARGGLSLVWGATMLPYCKEDTLNWPFDISSLENEFRELSEVIPITGASDGLSPTYGNFYSRRGIMPSNRIINILEHFARIDLQEIQIGLSRLAVETGTDGIEGCVYCNKCINGCPLNLIWSSKDSIFKSKNLKLRVLKLNESSTGVEVEAVDIDGEHKVLDGFEKVFLATGSLESFRILANSKIVSQEGTLKDSATFFLPLIALPKLGKLLHSSFGLSQAFIRLNKNGWKTASQFQLYEYSEDLIARAKKGLPFGSLIPNSVLRFFLKRMMVAIGYLDGADSPSIHMRLLEDGSTLNGLAPNSKGYKERNQVIRLSVKRLSRYIRKSGLLPIAFLTQIALPGEGVHFGSWLPMGEKSDLLGRPIGSKRIHVVDSSVLPTIAPGPITFTVMANAMRIAKAAVK
jgi:choline dehydrogenase-like flavoprotein